MSQNPHSTVQELLYKALSCLLQDSLTGSPPVTENGNIKAVMPNTNHSTVLVMFLACEVMFAHKKHS